MIIHHDEGGVKHKSSFDKPSPTIMKGGIFGDNLSHYYLEGERKSMKKKMNKPPYCIPSMVKVRKMEKKNGLSVISTFSGCGGSSLGYRMAGFDVIFANEFWDTAADVYEANSQVKVCRTDICQLTAKKILKATDLSKGELDILDGSPPCQTFSTAGKRDMRDDRTDLFMEYIRLLKGLQPRVFVAENVSGMVKGVAKGMFKTILKNLKGAGYNVEAQLLDAQWLGIPQVRKRIIFVGIRNDLKMEPVFPKPFTYQYSVADACPWITRVIQDPKGQFKISDQPGNKPCDCITGSNGYHLNCEGKLPKYLYKLPPVCERELDGKDTGGGMFTANKPSDVCSTIATIPHNTLLKTERRKFTIGELKRIMSFPDDFDSIPAGSYSKQWAVYGNSVPPLMMKAIASTVAEKIFCVRKRKLAKRRKKA